MPNGGANAFWKFLKDFLKEGAVTGTRRGRNVTLTL